MLRGVKGLLVVLKLMQRYDVFWWGVEDWWVLVGICRDCSGLRTFRGSEPIENGLHLAGRKGLAVGIIAHLLEFVPEHVVAADEGHEVFDGGVGGAVGEVEEGQLFFGVGFHG